MEGQQCCTAALLSMRAWPCAEGDEMEEDSDEDEFADDGAGVPESAIVTVSQGACICVPPPQRVPQRFTHSHKLPMRLHNLAERACMLRASCAAPALSLRAARGRRPPTSCFQLALHAAPTSTQPRCMQVCEFTGLPRHTAIELLLVHGGDPAAVLAQMFP